jgi:cytochrome c oxidase subunit II
VSAAGLPPGSGAVAARYEARWAIAMTAFILLLLAMIVFTGVHFASMPPSRVETIDATTLDLKGEFVEGNLGTHVTGDGKVLVHLLAEQYAFRPSCVVLPAGVPVTFRATSADVVHGLDVMGTNVNTMLVPGYISTFVATFHDLGGHAMPCHEFCGTGHEAMWARVVVLPKARFDRLARANPRPACPASGLEEARND